MSEPHAEDYLGAIELAIEGAANDDAALRIIAAIIENSPQTSPNSPHSVKILVEAVKALGGSHIVPGSGVPA